MSQQEQRVSGEHGHVPVLLDRMVQLLTPAVETTVAENHRPVLVDGTLGAGGHTERFLETFPTAFVIGFDRDAAALEAATKRLAKFHDRFIGIQARFDALASVLNADFTDPHVVTPPTEAQEQQFAKVRQAIQEAGGITGALYDLGVSSMQLDQVERGFAYRVDAPLDMRMDPSQGITVAEVLNTYSHGDLARILSTYGDERFAGKIASAVLRRREAQPFTTSGPLVELLYDVIPAASRRTGGHPAKRTFQALRVEVNRELEAVEQVIPQVTDALRVGGRAVFMSYQSLEDRIVKSQFGQLSKSKTPPDLPMELPGYEARFSQVTRGAEKASQDEIAQNSRAASVRVRAIERIRPATQSSDQTPTTRKITGEP